LQGLNWLWCVLSISPGLFHPLTFVPGIEVHQNDIRNPQALQWLR